MYAFTGVSLTVALNVESLPSYSVQELNEAIGTLLERGFAPRFLLHASVSKRQVKKGHLWLTLTDGKSSIPAVIWASKLKQIKFQPNQDDGVLVVGKLNFWATRASLSIQVLDIRPSISTVMRKFEVVRALMLQEGLIDSERKRALPPSPAAIAILTSVPSSALADILRTAKERWPLTRLLVVPIPVQGDVAKQIQSVLSNLMACFKQLSIEAIVLARGGGSREDLMVFDNEKLCRDLAHFPVPVVTGLGHEDDLTVADLVADYRASTPTAAIVALLPSRQEALAKCNLMRQRLEEHCAWRVRKKRQALLERHDLLKMQMPHLVLKRHEEKLLHQDQLLKALSPDRWLFRGFSIVSDERGNIIKSVQETSQMERLIIRLKDGQIISIVDKIKPDLKTK